MTNSMSSSDGRWCTRADAMLGVEGVHVSSVAATATGLVLRTETEEDIAGCPDCGVVAVGHGRRQVRLHDILCFGRPVRIETTRRITRGFRNFTNYRVRCLLAAGGHRPYRAKPTNHA